VVKEVVTEAVIEVVIEVVAEAATSSILLSHLFPSQKNRRRSLKALPK